MKQMNKKELIEYFIEQLGDNEILGKIMSIEQIKEKLNYVIKDVTYEKIENNITIATWELKEDGRGILNFDISKQLSQEEWRFIVVHEVLHALSSTIISLGMNNEYNKQVEVMVQKVRDRDKSFRIIWR